MVPKPDYQVNIAKMYWEMETSRYKSQIEDGEIDYAQ